MRNPMWFLEEKLDKVKKGQRALERVLGPSARSLSDSVGPDAKFAAEIVRQVMHRLLLTMIEIGVASLVRKLVPTRPPARLYALPVA